MKRVVVCLLFMVVSHSAYGCFSGIKPGKTVEWETPDLRLRYSDVCFLTAHNAYANKDEGTYALPQQSNAVRHQLEGGVRAFELDLHKKDGEIIFSHGDPDGTVTGSGLNSSSKSPKKLITSILSWLDIASNQNEVVTLFLENYVSGDETQDFLNSLETRSGTAFNDVVMARDHWKPADHDGKWPTLQHMVTTGRRLVIFDANQAQSSYGYRTRNYMTQNQYGTYDVADAAQLRKKYTAGRALFHLNYFNNVSSLVTASKYNKPKQIKKVIAACRKNNILGANQDPNFISLNFVHAATDTFKLVNEINRNAAKKVQ